MLEQVKTIYADMPHWDLLAEKYLSRYPMPDIHTKCNVEGMIQWLDRLDMTEKDYVKVTNTTLQEFIDMNPAWSLRSFIGLILEQYDEEKDL